MWTRLPKFLSLVTFSLGVCGIASAHPVNFKDGIAVMPVYSADRSELEVNYTVSQKLAVALNSIDLETPEGERTFFLPQLNYKLYRKNEMDSQSNVYGSIGLGAVANEDSFDANPGGLAALQADYETRRIYMQFNGEHLQNEGENFERLRMRSGVAPYLAPFEGLHTWLIAQAEYTPQLKNEWTVSPVVRLFYQTYLFEIGVSTRGDPFLAGIIHF